MDAAGRFLAALELRFLTGANGTMLELISDTRANSVIACVAKAILSYEVLND